MKYTVTRRTGNIKVKDEAQHIVATFPGNDAGKRAYGFFVLGLEHAEPDDMRASQMPTLFDYDTNEFVVGGTERKKT